MDNTYGAFDINLYYKDNLHFIEKWIKNINNIIHS